MRKDDLIKALQEIPGNPQIVLQHPMGAGAVTPMVNLIKESAGKNTAMPKSIHDQFETLHLKRYYPRTVKKAEDVVIFSIWPRLRW